MSAEQVLTLLDSFWFETTILTNKNPSNFHSKLEQNPQDTNLQLVPTPNFEVRFYSQQNLGFTGSLFSDTPSPKSVLTSSSKLKSIPSGREIREFSIGSSTEKNHKNEVFIKKKQSHHHRRRKSRSLSELEFLELKGFMDLGFVFSKEDKDSNLVSLIPGLQRLGKEEEDVGEGDDEEQHKKNIDENVVTDHNKPYLSEAWDVLDQKGRRNTLINWRVPDKGSEIDIKHSLKFWAHTVASIVS